MISLDDYYGKWGEHADLTEARRDNSVVLCERVNGLLAEAVADGVKLHTNPDTGTLISGQSFGGFRPQFCKQGAPLSSHKDGKGVDVYDPFNDLDEWITDEILARHDLYREHPSATEDWCHLTTRRPNSGNRTFYP